MTADQSTPSTSSPPCSDDDRPIPGDAFILRREGTFPTSLGPMRGDIEVARAYRDRNDWWIGYYRGDEHHYVCPLPTIVLRFPRRRRAD